MGQWFLQYVPVKITSIKTKEKEKEEEKEETYPNEYRVGNYIWGGYSFGGVSLFR
jgi:hypothetical protein